MDLMRVMWLLPQASSSAVAIVAPLAMPLWAAGATLLLAIGHF